MVHWPDEVTLKREQLSGWADTVLYGDSEDLEKLADDLRTAAGQKNCSHEYSWSDMTGEYVCPKCHSHVEEVDP